MKKLNNKGFTLIEMLVVIAIIAVLVAIIIPVVANSTTKAAAATDAANMRSFKAQIVTTYLQEKFSKDSVFSDSKALYVNNKSEVTVNKDKFSYPAMKSFKVGDATVSEAKANDNYNWKITFDSTKEEFTVTYCGYTITEIATVAETGAFPTT